MTLKVGDRAPDFKLNGDSGQEITLSSFKGKKVILYFYPKDDTPGCTRQACGFRDNYSRLQDANTVVLGISPDSVARHVKFKQKQKLPFPLLSDPEHVVTEKYGAWGEKNSYGRKYMGVIRSHFVIDERGKIADIQIGVKPEQSVERAVERVI
jgi:thioredoxin-dependent peroxiredoxin